MGGIADLESMFGPSETDMSEIDWKSIEGRLGVVFPNDYKEWAGRYPALYIDEFLRVLHPLNFFSVRSRGEIADELSGISEIDPRVKDVVYDSNGNLIGNDLDIDPIFPECGGLLPWGNTDNGDILMWLTHENPQNWTIVVVNGDGIVWQEFDCGFVEFLVSFFRGRFVTKVLSSDLKPAIKERQSVQAVDGSMVRQYWRSTSTWSQYFYERQIEIDRINRPPEY